MNHRYVYTTAYAVCLLATLILAIFSRSFAVERKFISGPKSIGHIILGCLACAAMLSIPLNLVFGQILGVLGVLAFSVYNFRKHPRNLKKRFIATGAGNVECENK